MMLTKADFGTHLSVYPVPHRLDYLGRPLPQRSDDWMVSEVTDDSFQITNTATGIVRLLPKSCVRTFYRDPNRWGGVNHGFVDLSLQIVIQGANAWERPAIGRRFRRRRYAVGRG